MKKSTAGFTLVELLVAMAIMAVVMAAALVAYSGTRATARDGRRKADLETIRSALELYRSDSGGYPLAAGYAVQLAGYISSVPKDPLDPARVYGYAPQTCGSLTCPSYTLCAAMEQVTVADAQCTAAGANCGIGMTCSYATTNP